MSANQLRSKGSDELAAYLSRTGGTREEQAARFGVTRMTLQRWLNGDATPNAERRVAIAAAGGPLPLAWDEVLPPRDAAPPAPPTPAAPPEPVSAEDTRALAAHLHRMAQEQIRALQDSGTEDPKLLAKMGALADIVVQLGKLTGAAGIDERRIVASPAWARLWDRMCTALEPYPDAMKAAADALLRADP